ncbi:LysM peptidoglycan-binding domain-containing protein [Mucilaginibacter sp. BT774]|uniref:LysM peptidoglycan-binding domain-containing protein n=1 Tax=Mucilaginibacter sp. BT774 TaxID=3062276 RepID=UPI0026773B5E|nr:LysM peptidoglycan-binding domain-containing protein [Mucilaginibacter sp. BT774]MDO3628818.1 LysM peptidoglycan-binding domain-containing protein [Mucilaginibacter sp. BT774]
MNFKLLLTLLLSTFSISVFARPLTDSVGVENHNGKKVILHKLDPKDNFYSIGRRYNVSPKAIIKFNPDAKMSIGNIIKVPTDKPFVEAAPVVVKNNPVHQNKPVQQPAETKPQQQQPVPQQQTKPANTTTDNSAPTQYKVSAGETLYAISKRFNTTVEDIVNLNGLKSNNISPGQVLLVKSNTATPSSDQTQPTTQNQPVETQQAQPVVATRDSTSPDSSHHINNANKFGIYEKDEKGVATWMDDDGLDPNKMLVLHRTAPIGTVIKITNVMTNRTTFAKVVGRFTDNEQTKDVIIVMTKNVATALGALDKRFQVNLSYGTSDPNN